MTTLTTPILGVDITDRSTTPVHRLGTRVLASNNRAFVYVQADGAIASVGQVVLIDENFQAALINLTNSATARGDLVGVAGVALADNEYGFVQVQGPCVVQVAASCAANVRLNTTATSGQLDDDGTAGSEVIDHLVLTTARGGSAGTAAALLSNNPAVGATL